MDSPQFASLPFSEAADRWLNIKQRYVKPTTYRVYCQYSKTLTEYLGVKALDQVTIQTVRDYQSQRSRTACATRVNAELSALQMILGEWDLWRRIERLYRPLPIPKTKVRQNMSEEEEKRLRSVILRSDPRRQLAGHCLIVMANTTMGFGELRMLRRADVRLNEDTPFVEVNAEGAKNDYRLRAIPLNRIALDSMRWIIKRWDRLGGTERDQFILPHHGRRTETERASAGHKRSTPLFHEPMGHIYRAARAILQDAGLGHLKIYDMRSHAITKLLSDPDVSEMTSLEIAGHISRKMQRRYSSQRMETKAAALNKICEEHSPQTLAVEAAQPRREAFLLQSWTGSGFYFSNTR